MHRAAVERAPVHREATELKERSAREKPIKQAIAKIEAEIEQLDAAQKEAETLMASPDLYKDGARAAQVNKDFEARRKRIAALYAEWEEKLALLDNMT